MRLALKPPRRVSDLFHSGRKKFQGHAAAELGVLGFVHYTHPTRAQFAQNLVMQEALADERIRVHISRLIVSGGGGAVKDAGSPPCFPAISAHILGTFARSLREAVPRPANTLNRNHSGEQNL